MPLLAIELPTQYIALLEARNNGAVRLSTLEQAKFGWTHATAAGVMARSWSLPEEFARLIECHTQLTQLIDSGSKDVSAISVALSASLPAASDKLWNEKDFFLNAFAKIAGPGADPKATLAKVDQEFTEFGPVLKLAAPGKSLVQYFEEAQPVAV